MVSIKRYTDTLLEQTKTEPQGTLKITLNKQMDTFSFSPPTNLLEEVKWLLVVTSFEATNSVLKRTDENNSIQFNVKVLVTAGNKKHF